MWNLIVTNWDMLWTGAKPFLPGLFELWWIITLGTFKVMWQLFWGLLTAFIG